MNDEHPWSEPPRRLGGRFDLLDNLGVGGGAVVVRARDRQLHQAVAVKLLRSRDPQLQRRFTQESEVLARLDHPAIVRVLAHDRDGDDLYTVLELIQGPDLSEHLARTGPMPWRQVIEIGIQIADALEVAHQHGLIHRDVKPANIMLAQTDPPHVKLIDFGIVRLTDEYRAPTGAAPHRPTDMGQALGTPGYLPLEAGIVAPTPRFDVFGLGATLYELLTGKLPAQSLQPLQPLSVAYPACDAPDDLDLVLAAALAPEPDDRTQTASELGRALAAVRAVHPQRGAPSRRIDGRYELVALVGTGGQADAHLAVHRGAGHDLVLKLLRSHKPADLLRFTREAKLLQTFDHPALPRFYDYAPEATPPYIAMAHAPGRPASRLCSPPRLRASEVASVGVKLARVLAVIHARGVVHRDLNANNVLIDEHGAVTLLDFGCAELTEKFYAVPAGERRYLTPPEARVTIPSVDVTTLAWSAPELRAGGKCSDKSDVYSLGHLLFRLLTGKLPTRGADPPTSPQRYTNTCPEDLASAVMSALQIDPDDRPTAAALAQTLLDVLEPGDEPLASPVVVAPADSTPKHPPRSPPRIAPASALALVTVALAALVLAWSLLHPAAPRTDQATLTATREPPDPSAAPIQPAVLPDPAPTMPHALDTAAPALRRCSELANGLLILDFATVEGGEAFASVTASVSDSPAVDACVRAATSDLRFRPQHAGTFTKEYTP